jgi:hypothetical protein
VTSLQAAVEIQVVLEGVALPATKANLLAYARREDAEAAHVLETLPDREYRSLDDVAEELVHVQPGLPVQARKVPTPESDLPPGGDDYTNPDPEPGAVRHDAPPDNPPQKALEEQTAVQKKQQAKQQEPPPPPRPAA